MPTNCDIIKSTWKYFITPPPRFQAIISGLVFLSNYDGFIIKKTIDSVNEKKTIDS